MINKITSLQVELKKRNIYDFEFLNYVNFNLIIAGSFDFGYYHNVEIIFTGVSFVQCPTKFSSAKVRIATKEEKEMILKSNRIEYMEDNETVFCFSLMKIFQKEFKINFLLLQRILVAILT